jgi:hypothetical protein
MGECVHVCIYIYIRCAPTDATWKGGSCSPDQLIRTASRQIQYQMAPFWAINTQKKSELSLFIVPIGPDKVPHSTLWAGGFAKPKLIHKNTYTFSSLQQWRWKQRASPKRWQHWPLSTLQRLNIHNQKLCSPKISMYNHFWLWLQ